MKTYKALSIIAALSILAQSPIAGAQNDASTASTDSDKLANQSPAPVPLGASAAKPLNAVETGSAGGDSSPDTDDKTAKSKGIYIKEEPKIDPAGSPTRVHRPGQADTLPPTAPPLGGNGIMPLLKTPPPAPVKEKFPSVGQLENLMFGHSTPNIAVENRLDKLEIAIFQRDYPDLDIEHRIRRLKEVIVGEEPAAHPDPGRYADPNGSTAYTSPPLGTSPYSPNNSGLLPDLEPQTRPQTQSLTFPNYGHHDLNQQLSVAEAEKFGVEVVNEIRAQQGLNELSWDEVGFRVASEQIKDLIKRESVSHQNSKGENPDLRYSFAGGTDTLVENAILFPAAENLKPTRQLVVKIIESLLTRQDDRDSLLFAPASGFAMSFEWTADRHKLICCTEIITKHGQMEPVPLEASVGDKIEIKGNVGAPYRFHKITLAWEGLPSAPYDEAESTEALPYFPPLDYEAHAIKSNKDFEKGVRILQIAGITAAIAGGMFIPPVALAAPLIAASVGTSTPKPVSEIPVRGGVKTDGNNFSHKVTLSNQGKEGIYYLTVWANSGAGDEIVPVSRRAIIARKDRSSEKGTDDTKGADDTKERPKGEESKNGENQQEPGAPST